jgi:DNA modification methylase
VEGQIGLEETPQAHICVLLVVFAEVWRVLRDDGTLWLNYGDCYATAQNGRSAEEIKADGRDDRTFRDKPFSTVGGGFKPKDLLLMPSRIAIALQEAGWYVRSEIVWAKSCPMPESVTDRPTCAHEKIFLLTKRERYYYDAEAVREPNEGSGRWGAYSGSKTALAQQIKGKHGQTSLMTRHASREEMLAAYYENGRNMRNVWTLSPEPFAEAHFAVFPSEIPRRAILAGTSEKGCCPKCGKGWKRVVECERGERNDAGRTKSLTEQRQGRTPVPERGWESVSTTVGWQPSCSCSGVTESDILPAVVLDPFSGAGTSALVAKTLGRSCICIELNPDYIALTAKRLAQGVLEIR